ncbi:tyrosine-protein phosphatase [Actinoplanes subglobosus]|uniref:Tyrosine-protein phosphatase n=1 Tax=Actinoplanes subglobosus TaxID=1547892 RepID=A0ABV8IHE5_9ACTN
MRLEWPGCVNARDLGGTPRPTRPGVPGDLPARDSGLPARDSGLPARDGGPPVDGVGLPLRDGGSLREGLLIRSDSHALLTPAAVAALRERPPALILDLRWPRECAASPSPFAADAFYRNVPLLSDPLGYDPPDDSYAPMLDHNGPRVARSLREVAAAGPGAVIVHCHGGRDRTGLLVAILLTLAGVAPDDIAADYAETPGCDAAAMRHTVDHAEARYGGIESYLLTHDVTPAEIEAIRSRFA